MKNWIWTALFTIFKYKYSNIWVVCNQQCLISKDICKTTIYSADKPNLENLGQKIKKAYFYYTPLYQKANNKIIQNLQGSIEWMYVIDSLFKFNHYSFLKSLFQLLTKSNCFYSNTDSAMIIIANIHRTLSMQALKLTCIISYKPPSNHIRWILSLSCSYTWKKWGTKTLSDFLKIQ